MRIGRRWLLFAATGLCFSTSAMAQPEETLARPVHSLSEVKRLCVEDFDGGENARQLRAMLIAEIHRLGSFVITENPKKADAFIRGFGEDLVFTEQHSRDENVTGRSQGAISTGGYTRNRASASQSVGGSAAARDRSEIRRHEASLTVRIVNVDGDVLWGGTAESRGGKFRSAGADVAEKIVKSIKGDLAAAAEAAAEGRKPNPPSPAN